MPCFNFSGGQIFTWLRPQRCKLGFCYGFLSKLGAHCSFFSVTWSCFVYECRCYIIGVTSRFFHAPVCYVFIARQHAMYAERDMVMAFLCVCPSVRLSDAIVLNEWTYCQTFWRSGRGIILVSKPHRHYKIPRGTPSAGGVKYTTVGNFANIAFYLLNPTRQGHTYYETQIR